MNPVSGYGYAKQDEEERLIHSVVSQYGSVSRNETKAKKKVKKYGLGGLFRFASKCDILLMIGGSLMACIVGSTGPVLGMIFGKMTDVLSRASLYGFTNDTAEDSKNSTFLESLTWDIFNASFATNDTDDPNSSPISREEFLASISTFSLYYLLLACSTFIATYLMVYQWENACERQVFKLRTKFLTQVLRQEIEWFDSHELGDLSSKLTDDLERVKEGLGHKFGMVIQYLATLVSGITVGLLANWQLTCVMLAIAPLVIGSSAFMAKSLSGGAAREQLRYSFAGKVAEEVLTCIRTVAAFGGERVEIARYDEALEKGKKAAMRKYYGLSGGMCFVSFVTYASYGFAFWYSAQLIVQGSATVGSIFTVFFSVMAGALGIGAVLPYLNSVSIAQGSASVILGVIDRKPHIDPYSEEGLKINNLEGKIEFSNVHFAYPMRPGVMVLKGLNVTVEPGQSVAFIGSSGAGKSTLVNLIMRFYDVLQGQVLLDGRDIRSLNLKWLRENIGIVSQEPTLFGVTIAENISYGREGVTMNEIIDACKLANAHTFIKSLPEGYQTKVGDRGTQLSGGQKQRIAIARAIVRNPKILLLDEATSALDAQSETAVQAALEKAKKGRTTLIIAHRLSTIKDSDLIYAMKDGNAVESGTHDELMGMKGLYYELVTLQSKAEKDQSTVVNDNYEKSDTTDTISLASSMVLEPVKKIEKTKRKGTIRRLISYNMSEWYLVLAGCLFCAITGFITPAFAFFYSQEFVELQSGINNIENDVYLWAGLFVGLGVVAGVAFLFQILAMTAAAECLLARMRLYCFESIIKQQLSWFDKEEHSCGALQTMLAKEAPIVKSCSGIRAGQIVSTCCTLLLATIIALIYGWMLALLLLSTVPILIYTSYKQMCSLRYSLVIQDEWMNKSGKVAAEGVQNVKTVQSLGSQELFVKEYVKNLETPYRENMKQALWLALTCALAYAIPYVVYAATFRLGAYLITVSEMGPDDVYRVFFSISLSAAAIGSSSALLQDVSKGKKAAEEIFEIIDTKSVADPTSEDGIDHEIRGAITFEDVHFTYPARPDIKILNGINLTVNPGESVALVGESGCGKSTIISLLEKFYTPDKGKIKVDGIEVNNIRLSSLRKQMGIVTQEPVLFSGTIKYNISYGALDREVSDAEIIKAAKAANIHDFICKLPLGYETPCGDRGTQLSGGQKQRIAIARAILRDPKILLLDEATSALDVESEKVVHQALDRASVGRTSLIVSHRLSTVKNADKIVVIQKGKVVESGTHDQLIESRGFYYELVKKQEM